MSKSNVKKPNVVRGGIAIPLGRNYYYMSGRKHSDGGIDIGKNPRTGLEVEDGEVMHIGNKNIKVFSAQPFLDGESPAQRVMQGDNPNSVFNAQESYKRRNKINNDGTKKKRMGGKRNDNDSLRNELSITRKKYKKGGVYTLTVNGKTKLRMIPSTGSQTKADTTDRTKAEDGIVTRIKRSFLEPDADEIVTVRVPNGNGRFHLEKHRYGDLNTDLNYGYNVSDNTYSIQPNTGYAPGVSFRPNPAQISRYVNTANRIVNQVRASRNAGAARNAVNVAKGKANIQVRASRNAGAARNAVNVAKGKANIQARDIRRNYLRETFNDWQTGTPFNTTSSPAGLTTSRGTQFTENLTRYNNNGRANIGLTDRARFASSFAANRVGNNIRNFAKNHPTAATWIGVSPIIGGGGAAAIGLMNYLRNSTPEESQKERVNNNYIDGITGANVANNTPPEMDFSLNLGVDELHRRFPSIVGKPLSLNYNSRNVQSSEDNTINNTIAEPVNTTTKSVNTNTALSSVPIRIAASTPNTSRNTRLTLTPKDIQSVSPSLVSKELSETTPLTYNTGVNAQEINTADVPVQQVVPSNFNIRNFIKNNPDVIGSAIGLGSNIIGSIISNRVNSRMLDNLQAPPQPTPRRASKLKTSININPQLDRMRESLAEYERHVNNNTASSRVALARNQRARSEANRNANVLYAERENMQNDLINKDKMNQQQVANLNIRDYNKWQDDVNTFENNRRNLKAENNVSLINNINSSVQDMLTRSDQRNSERQTRLALMAAYPNVNPRILRDLGIRGITDEDIYNWDRVYGYRQRS